MKRRHTCRTCDHFRPGASSNMSWPAPIESDDELGVCEYTQPEPAQLPIGGPSTIGLQPVVHESRSCAEYMPHADYDGDDDGGGETVTASNGKSILKAVA